MGLFSSIFGGSSSGNKAFGQIQKQVSPAIGAGIGGVTQLGNELSGGFDDYLKKSGFNFALGEGMRDVTGAGAAKGLLRSGASTRALARFADGLKGQRYDNFLGQLGNLGQLGIGAAGTVSNAGQSSKSTPGVISGLGTLFSDRRVKTDIVQLARVRPGLYLYSFKYIGLDLPTQMGFMADEVKRVLPSAVSQAFYAPAKAMRDMVDYAQVLDFISASQKEAA